MRTYCSPEFNIYGQRRAPPLAPTFSLKPYVFQPSTSKKHGDCCGGLTCRYVGGNTGNVLRRPPPNCCTDCDRPRQRFV